MKARREVARSRRTRAPLSSAYAAILVAAILSALLAPICVSSFSAFISSCKLSLSKAAAFGRLS